MTPASPPRAPRLDILVVGSGPNGLAAAVVLARAGLSVHVVEAEETLGGGARTLDLGLAPGIVHDICSAVQPMAVASPFLREFDLSARGVGLATPEASYAQPLDDEPAAIAWRDLDRAAAGLGADGPAWRALLGPLAHRPDVVTALALGDKRSVPAEALRPAGAAAAALFGTGVLVQGTRAWGSILRTERARALLTGVAAHAIGPLPSLAAGGTSMFLGALAHAGGWPIPVGGTGRITDALVADLLAHGGAVETGRRISGPGDLEPARATLLDVSADGALRILAGHLAPRVAGGLRRLGHGGAAAKLDLVVSGPIPWRDRDVGRAGTVHLGGTRAQMAAAEADVVRGRVPERPVVLVSDPAVVDPTRSVDGLRPVWAYAHVPVGCPLDPTAMIVGEIERAAPGFADTIVASSAIPAARMPAHNAALVGGDIALGTVDLWRMVARPRAAWNPWRLTDDGHYLCSAASVPGPGVHGMPGYFAARSVLAERFGIRQMPGLAPDA
ncbi:phytoene desaturase family protein [Brachybacterium huguangmaarense]